MLNVNLDLNSYSKELTLKGRIQISSFLEKNVAQQLFNCLDQEVPWDFAYYNQQGKIIDNKTLEKFSSEELSKLMSEISNLSDGEYMYAYKCYMMVTAYLQQRNPGFLLDKLLEGINSPDYLNCMRQLTRDNSVVKINAQATCYQKGHFLRAHNDFHAEEGRLYAYVINLTKDWQADWGGLLNFLDDKGSIEQVMMPTFNSLSIFKVPKMHHVSQVTSFANKNRYAITGWLLNK